MFNKDLRLGEPMAFDQLFRQAYPRLEGYCRLFVSDRQMAGDIVQDCFLKLWEKRENISDEKSVEALLYTMVRNRCLNYLRDNQKISYPGSETLQQINELQFLYQIDFQGKEELSLEEMLIEAIRNSIEKLPPKTKSVFMKSKLEGQKQQDIARELDISVKMVEKYIRQAKDLIRADVEKKFPAFLMLISVILN